MIEIIAINSENIDYVGYNNHINCLHIKFEDDDTEYLYKDVKLKTFTNFLFSGAKRKYLEENVFCCCEKVAV